MSSSDFEENKRTQGRKSRKMPKGGVDFMTNVDQWPPLAKALLRIYVVVNQLFHLYSGKRLGLRLISTFAEELCCYPRKMPTGALKLHYHPLVQVHLNSVYARALEKKGHT